MNLSKDLCDLANERGLNLIIKRITGGKNSKRIINEFLHVHEIGNDYRPLLTYIVKSDGRMELFSYMMVDEEVLESIPLVIKDFNDVGRMIKQLAKYHNFKASTPLNRVDSIIEHRQYLGDLLKDELKNLNREELIRMIVESDAEAANDPFNFQKVLGF